MKKILVFILMFFTQIFLSQDAYSQNIDIETVNKELNRAETLISQHKYQEAKEILNSTIPLCRTNAFYAELAIGNYLKGDIYYAKDDFELAFNSYWTSFTVSRFADDPINQFESSFRIGEIFYHNNQYNKALEYYDKCDRLIYVVRTSTYRILLNDRLSACYFQIQKYDKAIEYYFELRKYSIQYQSFNGEMKANRGIAKSYEEKSDFGLAIEYELASIPRLKSVGLNNEIDKVYLRIASDYRKNNQAHEADRFYNLVIQSPDKTDSTDLVAYLNCAKIYLLGPKVSVPRVSKYLDRALNIATKIDDTSSKIELLNLYALMYFTQLDKKLSKEYINKAIKELPFEDYFDEKLMVYAMAIKIYEKDKEYDLVSQYQKNYIEAQNSKLSLREQEIASEMNRDSKVDKMEQLGQISSFDDQLMMLFQDHMKQKDLAYESDVKLIKSEHTRRNLVIQNNLQQVKIHQDSLNVVNENRKVEKQLYMAHETELKARTIIQKDSIQKLKYESEIRAEQNAAGRAKRARNYLFAFILIGLFILIVLLVFFISIRKSNKLLKEKNLIIAKEQIQTEETLVQLKSTQSQLIESERLASLGQLTAGIAHEIRNPLNFVNNFSELNIELSIELRDELERSKISREENNELLELSDLIKGNNEKINEHGERASRIINQMLDSSRKGNVNFEKTDINQLVKESANLAYQGVKGRNVDFVVNIDFDLDPDLEQIKVINHDLGRVIINLVTNSCHAMLEKANLDSLFKPTIIIKTEDLTNSIQISIEDNGIGMSKEIINKIFDPFFTTKPSGVGTGLGLTMSFDIVTKVHKGKINLESELNEFTRFILELPKNLN